MFSILKTYETYLKIAVILIYTGFIWYCHTIYDDSKISRTEEKQVVKAQAGETKQVEYQQTIQKVYVKDSCKDTTIPAPVLKLLR